MVKKLLPVVIINLLLLYISIATVYSKNQQHKVKLPKEFLKQVVGDNDPETYDKYNGNLSKLTESPPILVCGLGKSRLKSKPNKVRLKIKSFNKDVSQLNS